jgi:hypothetical protein
MLVMTGTYRSVTCHALGNSDVSPLASGIFDTGEPTDLYARAATKTFTVLIKTSLTAIAKPPPLYTS